MRVAPSSRTVPAASSAFATATSSSDLRTTAFSVSAYVAMGILRRHYTGSAESLKAPDRSARPEEESHRGARERDPGGGEEPAESVPEAEVARDEDLARRAHGLVQVGNRLADDRPIDAAFLVRVREQKAVVGEDVDESRNPAGIPRDPPDRAVGEQSHVGRARHLQPGADVLVSVAGAERRDVAAKADPPPDVTKSGMIDFGRELRLPDQQDLEQFAGRALGGRKQADSLECRRVEVLRLVNDYDGLLPGALTLEQEAPERGEPPLRRFLGLGDSQVLEQPFDDAVERQGRVEDIRHRGVLVEALVKGPQQRGLARAGLAGQDDEASAFARAVLKLIEDLAVSRAYVEKSRVRCHVERVLVEPEETQIHDTGTTHPRSCCLTSQSRSRFSVRNAAFARDHATISPGIRESGGAGRGTQENGDISVTPPSEPASDGAFHRLWISVGKWISRHVPGLGMQKNFVRSAVVTL